MATNKLVQQCKTGSRILLSTTLAFLCCCASTAYGAFDLNAGVEAATAPLIGALDAHWGKGVLLASGVSALLGEGDARQRAQRAAVGGTVAAAVVLGAFATFG